jgi:hypothetical protein
VKTSIIAAAFFATQPCKEQDRQTWFLQIKVMQNNLETCFHKEENTRHSEDEKRWLSYNQLPNAWLLSCGSANHVTGSITDTPLFCTVELDFEGFIVSTNILYMCRVVGMGPKLIGCGSAVPKFEISNDDLAKIVAKSDEWISVRTGIRKRWVLTGKLFLQALV